MLRYLPVVLALALTVYCLVDATQTAEPDVRNLPKIGWLAIILVFPLGGPAAWLIAGRPPKGPRALRQPPRPRGPDDDPDFLKDL